jgi:hypothetical protein
VASSIISKLEFTRKAVRAYERQLGLPPGWWGDTWRHVYGPSGISIAFKSGGAWSFKVGKKLISNHDDRASAIRKAKQYFAKFLSPAG